MSADSPKIKEKGKPIGCSGWFTAVVLFFIVATFAGAVFPGGSHFQVRGAQTKALAQAKQIGLALKLYAGDHDGVYPTGVNSYGQLIHYSNDAFRDLFPTYTQSESIFGNKLSAYQTTTPDNVITPKEQILKPGENVFSYIMGVTESMPPETPLVADGTNGDGDGHYGTDTRARGGVWAGTKAIIIRLDNSGAVENLWGTGDLRYVRVAANKPSNLLSREALGPQLRLLDPEVEPASSAK